VQSLRGEVAELQVVADVAGASILVDGRKIAETPQTGPLFLDPGPHELLVAKTGLSTVHTQQVVARAGQPLTVTARLAVPTSPLSVATPVAPTSGTRDGEMSAAARTWQRPFAWATAATATVAAGLFATTLVLRHRRVTAFNSEGCGTDAPAKYDPDCPELLERADEMQEWAIASGVATGTLGLGAALLFATLPEVSVRVSLQASPARLGLTLQGRY
jgi:hypothetical protein